MARTSIETLSSFATKASTCWCRCSSPTRPRAWDSATKQACARGTASSSSVFRYAITRRRPRRRTQSALLASWPRSSSRAKAQSSTASQGTAARRPWRWSLYGCWVGLSTMRCSGSAEPGVFRCRRPRSSSSGSQTCHPRSCAPNSGSGRSREGGPVHRACNSPWRGRWGSLEYQLSLARPECRLTRWATVRFRGEL